MNKTNEANKTTQNAVQLGMIVTDIVSWFAFVLSVQSSNVLVGHQTQVPPCIMLVPCQLTEHAQCECDRLQTEPPICVNVCLVNVEDDWTQELVGMWCTNTLTIFGTVHTACVCVLAIIESSGRYMDSGLALFNCRLSHFMRVGSFSNDINWPTKSYTTQSNTVPGAPGNCTVVMHG